MNIDSQSPRKKVAREAASLLYSGAEKEYKQAKLRAAKTSGIHHLPTNLEVALELDKMAEENEGQARQERLVRMRQEALRLMRILKMYAPLLIGSVWRGTIHHESDIDIVAYHEEPEEILKILKQNTIKIAQAEWVTVTEKGERRDFFHIYAELPDKEKAEIKIGSPEEAGKEETCETYQDRIVGLTIRELEELLDKEPTRRFVPF